MATNETTPKIFQAINNVMGDIGAIGKGKKNATQGFMYRGIDDVMNVLQPLLVKHKIFVCPEVLEQTREERTTKSGGNMLYSILKMRFTFFAADGTNIVSTVVGEGMDSGDKASNKAMSVAFKYACFQVFCIPTEEMKDPDGDTPESTKPKPCTKEQAERMKELDVKMGGVKQRYGVDKLENLTYEQAEFVIASKEAALEKNATVANATKNSSGGDVDYGVGDPSMGGSR